MNDEAIAYLKRAGYEYCPSSTPRLFTHLEGEISESSDLGVKFTPISLSTLEAILDKVDHALLSLLVGQHKKEGSIHKVRQVIELPFVVGTIGVIPLASVPSDQLMTVIDHPGTPAESLAQVLPVEDNALPCTRQITITGGTYLDGHSAGLMSLIPGDGEQHLRFGGKCAYMVSKRDLRSLLHQMESAEDDIRVITRHDCQALLARIRAHLAPSAPATMINETLSIKKTTELA